MSKPENKIIRIKIDKHLPCTPDIEIQDLDTEVILASVKPGSVAEIETDRDIMIRFIEVYSTLFVTIISPNGTCNYRARWGDGTYRSVIVACDEVDEIL